MDLKWSLWLSHILLLFYIILVHGKKNDFEEEELEEFDDDDMGGIYHKHKNQYRSETGQDSDANEEIFYFFGDHDFDENQKLDGTELLQAMYHEDLSEDEEEEEPTKKKANPTTEKWRIRRMSALVDKALAGFDLNKDGYFDWQEFKQAATELKLVN